MRISQVYIIAVALILLSACKNRKPAVSEASEATSLKVEVIYTEMYCGGAPPPPDIIEEMERVKPLANTKLYLVTLGADPKTATAYKTDKLGILDMPLDTGFYELYLFDPTKLPEMSDELTEQQGCDRHWKLEQRYPLTIKKGTKPHEVMIMKMCNPCEEPRP